MDIRIADECEHCLKKELSDEEYYEIIRECTDIVPPEKRADANTYQQRLLMCSRCEYLQNGICRMCGCFVRIRAFVAESRCPMNKIPW